MKNEIELLIKILKNYQESLNACIVYRNQKKESLEHMGFHWQEYCSKELLVYHQKCALEQKAYSQDFLDAYKHYEQYYFFQNLDLEKNKEIIQRWITQIEIHFELLNRLQLTSNILEKFTGYYLELIHLLRYPSYTNFEFVIDKNLYKGVYFIKNELPQNELINSILSACRNSLDQFVQLAIDTLKTDLKDYIHGRESKVFNYYFLFGSYTGGFSKKEKISAAESFLSLLEHPKQNYMTFQLGALKQGELSKIINQHQHLFSSQDFEDKDTLIEACQKLHTTKEIIAPSSFF